MIQIGSDFYEDLDAARLNKLLDEFEAGRTPKPGPQIDRQFSAPVGGATTLTDASLYADSKSGGGGRAAPLTDASAKRPGAAANVRDAATPQAPVGDKTSTDKPKPA
jgi:NADH-quinone oxidoreductase subunit E